MMRREGKAQAINKRWTKAAVFAGLVVIVAYGLLIGLGALFVGSLHGRGYQGPTIAEVERGAARAVRGEGQVSHTNCHQVTRTTWDCQLRFTDGHVVLTRTAWYKSQDTIGISVVQRIPASH
jgi:hypothetical protein